MTDPDAIAKRAYELFLERGSEPGYEIDDWLQAEAELNYRAAAETGVEHVAIEASATEQDEEPSVTRGQDRPVRNKKSNGARRAARQPDTR